MNFKDLNIYFVTICITLIISFSCQVYRNVVSKKQSNWSLNPVYDWHSLSKKEDNNFYPIIFRISDESQNNTFFKIAEIEKQSCSNLDEDRLIKIHTNFKSIFGSHIVQFELSASNTNYGAKASIDNTVILLNFKNKLNFDTIKKICESANSKSDYGFITEDFNIKEIIKSWLLLVAPDCEFDSHTKNEWFCNIEDINSQLVLEELKDIQVNIIKRWNRQPYLIIRRIAITLSFLEVINKIQEAKTGDINQLNKVCKMISLSNPSELPVALATSRWQKVVCNPNIESKLRIEAAKVGLGKAFAEIEFLRELFERTSHLGVLSVRVSKNLIPTKDIWVKLIPQEDVTQILAEESKNLGGKIAVLKDGDFEQPKACWHPLFANNEEINLFYIARHLGLIGETQNISCLEQFVSKGKSSDYLKATIKYLTDSITSETEFVLTNGHSKILRLPIGTYSYIIKGYVNDLSWEEVPENEINIKGEIKWTKKRPSIFIKHN